MNAVVVCVNYDDLLAITLPRMASTFSRVLVVTDNCDQATAEAVSKCGANLYRTDVFYQRGAAFNKGAALEEAFDALGRHGWMCVIDADILLPEQFAPALSPGCLHAPRRRLCAQPRRGVLRDWSEYRVIVDTDMAGFCQIFHADDPILAQRPWYDTGWKHAGGCDSSFQARWDESHRIWLPFEVLHLGPISRNWWGRTTRRMDGMMPAGAEEAARLYKRWVAERHRVRGICDWEKIQ